MTPARGDAQQKAPLAHVVGALALGLGLRLVALTHQSFWYDEAVSTRLARAPLVEILRGHARDLGNPPLHLILLHLWMQVFGTSDAAVRAMSAVAGAASIPLVYVVARRLTSGRTGLLAAWIFALAPVQIYFAQEARAYTLLTLVCLASMLFLLRAVESPRRAGSWLGFGVATFLAMYAHYFALFFVLGQAAWLLAFQRRERRALLSAFAALAGAGLVYAGVWLPSLIDQLRTTGNLGRAADTWYLHILATPLVFGVGTTLLWKGAVSALRVAAGGIALVAFAGCALTGCWSLRRDRGSMSLLLAWMLAPVVLPLVVSLTLLPFYYVRYALLAAPAYYIFIAAGLLQIEERLRPTAAGALIATSALSLWFYFTMPVKHDWRGAVAWFAAHGRPGDVLAFDADIGETAFAHYSGPDDTRIRLLEPPDRSPASRYSGTSPRRERVHPVDAQLRAARRVWFIFSDPGDGTGDYYRNLFAREWRRAGGREFRGIEVAVYTSGGSVAPPEDLESSMTLPPPTSAHP